MPSTTLLWFRQDLRLDDHPALATAVERGGVVIPCYVDSSGEEGEWAAGPASRWWLHHSLKRLSESLSRMGSRLIIRRGPVSAGIAGLAAETGADAVYWSRRYEPAARAQESAVESRLRSAGLTGSGFNSALLYEPWQVQRKAGGAFQVFTRFWQACLASDEISAPLPAPTRLPAPRKWPSSLAVEDLELLPTVDWAGGLRAAWTPGEAGAAAALERFADQGLRGYEQERNRPDRVGSSRLSPHLHWGELSPRRIWRAVREQARASRDKILTGSVTTYLAELGWREFAHHLLYHFPDTSERPLRSEFERFPWADDVANLKAWQRGLTGYPIVDAGMRELWHTGWMHNRVRMIVASFLTKDLLISWQAGAKWFWYTLVDADLANNTLGWQWTAGCGADAAPYFRIFNPVLQGERFDPQGDYVRRWVPELSRLSARWIHQPWAAPAPVLAAAGVALGGNYPARVVDHAQVRQRALAAYQSLRRPR